MSDTTEFTAEEMEMLKTIFKDCAAWEYIDYENPECKWHKLYEKVCGKEGENNA